MQFVTTRDVQGVVIRFEWHGGAYIDVGRAGATPIEVINVWDSAGDKPRIARTREAFEQKVDDWIAEYGPDSLHHDATVNWPA